MNIKHKERFLGRKDKITVTGGFQWPPFKTKYEA